WTHNPDGQIHPLRDDARRRQAESSPRGGRGMEGPMRRVHGVTMLMAGLAVLGGASSASALPPVPGFESGQVRPLSLSPSGKLLYAVNTPAAEVSVFAVQPHGLQLVGTVQVGLEPVAVAVRSEHEAWVVNHLSDSVSVVRLDQAGGSAHLRV